MIELLIEGKHVILPADFNVTIKKENPYITRNGEYTYNITLQLSNSINAELYSFLNRINSISEISEKRDAILISDNIVICQGIEIITGWNEKEVEIQIAAGNSELNALINDERLISSLDLGTQSIPSNGDKTTEHYMYPKSDYNLNPFYDAKTKSIINELYVHINYTYSPLPMIKHLGDIFIVQPYLCFIIEKIIKALGYSIGDNDIKNSIYKNLYFVHTNQTDEYSKMFPGWTIKDFIEEIEKLLNVTFLVNAKTKNVDILFNNNFYKNSPSSFLKRVEDDYEVEINTENDTDITNSNISYNLSGDIYKQLKVDDNIHKVAEYKSFENYQDAESFLKNNKPLRVIAKDVSTNRDFIYDDTTDEVVLIDTFKNLDRNSANEISFNIIPAANYLGIFKMVEERDYISGPSSQVTSEVFWNYPAIDSDNLVVDESEDKSISSIINDNISLNNEQSKVKLFLSFYDGLVDMSLQKFKVDVDSMSEEEYMEWLSSCSEEDYNEYLTWSNSRRFPLCFSDNFFKRKEYLSYKTEEYSLRLQILDKYLYTSYYNINTEKEYKFYCYDDITPPVNNIIVVKNKRYVVKDITIEISNSCKNKRWILTAYPINISDTEALGRWILSDGKWRDGGVWLDNGRWLD